MALLVDTTMEAGRIDIVNAEHASAGAVDVQIVLHVSATDDEAFARKLVARVVEMFEPSSAHVRARVYLADYNSVLLYPSDAGMQKWQSQLLGESLGWRAARQHYADAVLVEYRTCIREYVTEAYSTHEVCFADGAAIYWAGE